MKYPISSVHLGCLQNSLHPNSKRVGRHHPDVPLQIQTATPKGCCFSKGPSSVTAPAEKLLPPSSGGSLNHFCGRLAVSQGSARHCSSATVRAPPDLLSEESQVRVGGGEGLCAAERRDVAGSRGWLCSQWLRDLGKVILSSLSFLTCKNQGLILSDFYGTSQLPGPDSSGRALGP